MKEDYMEKRAQFGSILGFILVAAGSAIGLGNIWRFPYLTGSNGGGAFVLIYLLINFTVGISLLLVEFIIGRHGHANTVICYEKFNKRFKYLGFLNVFTSFIILAYYSVVGGWTIYYFIQSISGNLFNNVNNYETFFNNFIRNPSLIILFTFIFLFFTVYIVIKGINEGIEKSNKFMMPLLFILIIILLIRSVSLKGGIEGIIWYLKPDFSKINGSAIIAAMGQVFFSLSIGLSTMITYSSYLSKKEYLPKISISVAFLDFMAAFLSGFIIFPAVFAYNLPPNQGPGLVFITLAQVFSNMPLGYIFATLFFLLLIFAAISSSISMMEVAITYFIETYHIKRIRVSIFYSIIVFILSIPAALSFNLLENFKLLKLTVFDMFDFFCANISLPFSAILCAILLGWLVDKALIKNLYIGDNQGNTLFKIWYFVIKYIAPVAVIIIWLNSLKIF